jgi:hypothetical protein
MVNVVKTCYITLKRSVSPNRNGFFLCNINQYARFLTLCWSSQQKFAGDPLFKRNTGFSLCLKSSLVMVEIGKLKKY